MNRSDLKRAMGSEEMIDRDAQRAPLKYEDFSIQLDKSMLLESISLMEKNKETHISMHTLVCRLIAVHRESLASKPTSAPNYSVSANTNHFSRVSADILSPSLSSPASSISSTMPSPLFEHSPLGGTTPADSSFSNFKFKTPKKIIFPVDVIDLTNDPSDNKMAAEGPDIDGLPGDSQFTVPVHTDNEPKFQIGKSDNKGSVSKKKGKLTTAARPTQMAPPAQPPDSVGFSFVAPSNAPINTSSFASKDDIHGVTFSSSLSGTTQGNANVFGIGGGAVTSSGRPVVMSKENPPEPPKRNVFYPINNGGGDPMDISHNSFPSPTLTPDERAAKVSDKKSPSLGDIYLGQFKNMNIADKIVPPAPPPRTINEGPTPCSWEALGGKSYMQTTGDSTISQEFSAADSDFSVPSTFDPAATNSNPFIIPPPASFPFSAQPSQLDRSMDSVLKPFVGLKVSDVAGIRTSTSNVSAPGIENKMNIGGLFSGVGSTVNLDTSLFKTPSNNISFSMGADNKKNTGYAKKKNVRSKDIAKNSTNPSAPSGTFVDLPSFGSIAPPPVPEPSPEISSIDKNDEMEHEQRMIDLAELLRTNGRRLYSENDYLGALDSFSKALDAAPNNWVNYVGVMSNKAAALFMLSRFVEAIEVCDNAIAHHYLYVAGTGSGSNTTKAASCTLLKILARKGRAYMKIGNYPLAHSAFDEVLNSPKINQPLPYHDNGESDTFSGSTSGDAAMNKADEDAVRADVRAGVKQVLLAKVMFNRLQMLQTQSDFKQFAATSDDLLKLSPEFRAAQCFKANALCKLHQWAAAKEFIESSICGKPITHLRLFSGHPSAAYPPASQFLKFSYSSGNWSGVIGNAEFISGISSTILSMGPDLAKAYLSTLKNEKHSRFLCAETMDLLRLILIDVKKSLNGFDSWNWVNESADLLDRMIRLKTDADSKFRSNNFLEALNAYREFIKIDPDAHIWNAVMYGNRAAALMRLEMYSEAVSDCHQAIVRDPEYLRAYLRRARAYKVMREYDASLRDYKKYLDAAVDDPSVPTADRQTANSEMAEVIQLIKIKDQKEAAAQESKRYENSSKAWGKKASEFYEKREGPRQRPFVSSNDSSSSEEDDEEEIFRQFRKNNGKPPPQQPQSKSHYANFASKAPGSRFSADGIKPGRSDNSSGRFGSKPHAYQSERASDNSREAPRRNHAWDGGVPSAAAPAAVKATHYSILGISMSATEKEIKSAYRQLALKYHPDKNKDESAIDMFKNISESYSVLSDKATRRTYDYSIRYS